MYFSYTSEPVLERVYFKIFPLDMVSIIGPNGGGKTTLLKILLGLLKPDKGEVLIFDQSPQKVRSRIGYVPQFTRFDPMFPVSVMDVVAMGRLTNGKLGPYSGIDKEHALNALEEVELSHLKKRAFADLSGGQRQRVLIARALASGPDLLFLDEPTSSIDRGAEQRLYSLLGQLNKKLTILLATHDVGFVTKFVSHCLCVNKNVLLHPTSNIDGKVIQELYGSDMALVQHEHRVEHKDD